MAPARHDIVIVIPVADRPQHLSACLDSLKALLERYPHAGRVSVLVADDSRDAESRRRHEEIAAASGLDVHYLDQETQRDLVAALPEDARRRLAGVVGDGAARGHKGAAITRNIACLWLNRLGADGRRRLFWFIDSDQEFRVNLETAGGETLDYAIDYCHWLDRIFAETPVRLLTGKVVGDPPVSPAVMAGHFLDDVAGFLDEMAGTAPGVDCSFHGPARQAGDAAYHDMADLFGFKSADAPWRYRCPISGGHDHAACFAGFADRLDRFFDGEHPTRRSHHEPDDVMASLRPARTVYTGNYVIAADGLDWFVPFAALRLRMAGPTLGRIVRAEAGAAFVSASLPMLHKRTVAETGQSECRPGVERAATGVDLSGEFERQYFGDVMLFAMERLVDEGYPSRAFDAAAIRATVAAVEEELQAKYRAKHAQVTGKIDRVAARYGAPERWWHAEAGLAGARAGFERFLADMGANFGDAAPAWRQVSDPAVRSDRVDAIAAAIAAYPAERAAWRAVLEAGRR